MKEYLNNLRKEAIKHSFQGISIQETFNSDIDQFMHLTVRPILKLQHERILSVFFDFIDRNNIQLSSQLEQKEAEINKLLKSNQKIRHIYAGLLLAWIPEAELSIYHSNFSELNKRLINLIVQRIITSI